MTSVSKLYLQKKKSGTDNMALWCPVDILLATDITRWTVLTFPCNLYFALNERSILIVLGIPVLSMGLTVYSRSILSPSTPLPLTEKVNPE